MLSFRGKKISSAEFVDLVGDPAFAATTTLDVRDCPIGDEGLAALARSEHARGLQVLWADGVGASDVGVKTLAEARPMALRQLFLGYNGLTSAGLDALIASPVTQNLEILRLNLNPIGDVGARILGATAPRSLQVLFLARTEMTDAGFHALADSPRLDSLDWLVVTSNALSPEAVGILVDPNKLPALTTLEVDARSVDAELLNKLSASRPRLKIGVE